MRRIIQFKIYKGENYYIGECVDLPIVTQGRTLNEVAANIKEALSLHLEGTIKAIYRQALRYISENELREHFYTL